MHSVIGDISVVRTGGVEPVGRSSGIGSVAGECVGAGGEGPRDPDAVRAGVLDYVVMGYAHFGGFCDWCRESVCVR